MTRDDQTPRDPATDEVIPEDERTTTGSRLRRPRRRTFYSIGEVCELVGVKPHVLRYWESRIPELSPTKNRAGNRVYQAREIELISLINRLVQDERYTVDGARKRLLELRSQGAAAQESSSAMKEIFLRSLQAELQELYDFLDPALR